MPVGAQFLYPPDVESFMPAFLVSEKCKIYFSLTRFNNIADIAHVQLSFNYLDSNMSALKASKWPNGYKLCPIHLDDQVNTDHCYYIEIDPAADLEGHTQFAVQQYYKAQLRYSQVDPVGTTYDSLGKPIFAGDPMATWYADNIGMFSEWSAVCLIKAIPAPYISIQGLKSTNEMLAAVFDSYGLSAGAYDTFDHDSALPGIQTVTASEFDAQILAPIMVGDIFYTGQDTGYGSMVFAGQYSNLDTSEILDSYQAELYEKVVGMPLDTPVAVTEILHPDTTYHNGDKYDLNGELVIDYESARSIYNSFRFTFDTILKDVQDYRLKLSFTTKNGFVGTRVYDFTTALGNVYFSALVLAPSLDEDHGRIGVSATSQDDVTQKIVPVTGTLLVKRTDHRSNFTAWKTIYERNVVNQSLNETIYDYTAESGVLYKYSINDEQLPNPIMAVYDDIFLIGADKQLKIQFDPKVSSFKYVVQDSKVETLGGKYPFVIRNGDVKYREIGISGLISAQSDENNLFVEEADLYGGQTAIYEAYNRDRGISKQIDFIREKEFRDKVLDFLYDGQVKLYKSTTEGNILVRVTDVSLSPVDALGRMLYSFSANLTEVAEYSVENCRKHGIDICGVTTDLIYMIAATVVGSENGRDKVYASNWTTPVTISEPYQEVSAYNKAIVYLYQRASTMPALPTERMKYNFASKVVTGNKGLWSETYPDPDGRPLYVTEAKVSSKFPEVAITANRWSVPSEKQMNVASICLYKRGSSTPISSTVTYNFPDAALKASEYDALELKDNEYDALVFDSIETAEVEKYLSAYIFDHGGLSQHAFEEGSFYEDLEGWSLTVPTEGGTLYSLTTTVFSNGQIVKITPDQWRLTTVTEVANEITTFDNVKLVYLYFQAHGLDISTPPGSLVYDFTDKTLTGDTWDWSLTPPTLRTAPLYFTVATAFSDGDSATILAGDWTQPEFIGDLMPVYESVVYLYARQSGRSIPSAPKSDLDYNFGNETLSGLLEGWSQINPILDSPPQL